MSARPAPEAEVVCRHTPDGLCISVSESALAVLGRAPSELLGRSIDELARRRDAPAVRAIFRRASAGSGPARVAYRARRGGGWEWLETSAYRVSDDCGRPVEILSVTRPAAADAEEPGDTSLRALGQMAGGIAHDLNQALGLVVGHADIALQLLGRPEPDLPRVHEAVEAIVAAGRQGADTVSRLLSFARSRESGEPRRVDLAEMARDVAGLTSPRWKDTPQSEGRPIDLTVEAEDGAVVMGWASSLRELLTNLIFNAVDALPTGGRIAIRVRRRGRDVELAVADTGIGMPPRVRARVFEPFFSTKGAHGTGLGLSQAYAIARRHGGRVAVNSAPGRGTTLVVTLPAAPAGDHPSAESEPVAAPVRPLRILVVDDEERMTRMASLLLAADGHAVEAVTTGEDALAHLAEQEVDAVITDLSLGRGMNGWAVAERARALRPSARILLATGWGGAIDPAEARALGVDAVVAKPYRLADLRRALSPPA
jgi:PAS domain S-box-containing protein